jgi:RNA polymerase sigma factor (sigma-70 family)
VKSNPDKPRLGSAAEEIRQAYARYSGELKSFLARHSRRTGSAEDLMQEVYMELLRYSPREKVREPQAYLYKIAWHVVNRSNHRAQQDATPREQEELDRLATRRSQNWVSDASSLLDAEQQILEALSALPPLYGAVLILSRRDGLSYSEIARELKISVHTVRKYLTRAITHLSTTEWNR